MVLYFSATGNTAFAAQELARQLEDECVDLLGRIKRGDHTALHSEKPFVICAPVYVCEMPRFLSRYLKEQTFTGNRQVYFVFTSGGYSGISGPLAKRLMNKKGMQWQGWSEVKMPRNYVISDAYPMLEREETEKRIREAQTKLKEIAANIAAGGRLKARHVFLFELLITVPFNPVWCKYKQPAKDFYATDHCIGCGKCQQLCPIDNISLKDGKPVWKSSCAHCMACIANCPVEAIEYGTITQGKKKYRFGKYRYVVQ